jgi:Holliday junction resolvasome RuvABC endonuclease subunit
LFIGIDQSYTSTGIVVVDVNGDVVSTQRVTSTKEDDIFVRADAVSSAIADYVAQWQPTRVAIEGLAFGMTGSATRDLAGLQFLAIIKTRAKGFSPMIVSPSSLKKLALGVGKGSKQEMIAALPVAVADRFALEGYKKTKGLGDMADAYWLAQFARKTVQSTP